MTSVERVKEILVNDGKSRLELDTESLNDDLSNTETPEDGPQIDREELLKSDSIQNEALFATVVYVESDVGDSDVVRNSLEFVFII